MDNKSKRTIIGKNEQKTDQRMDQKYCQDKIKDKLSPKIDQIYLYKKWTDYQKLNH